MTTATQAEAPDASVTEVERQLIEVRRIPLDQLRESPLNPRKHYEPAALEELMASLLSSGQLTPIIVRPVPARKGAPGGYELAAGHRRYRAAKLAGEKHPEGAAWRGLDQLLAVVRELDDKTFIEVLTIENLQRDDLHPLEEAQGFADLVKVAGYNAAKIAARTGRSEKYVYDRLKLLQLIPAAKKLFLAGAFEAGHAIILARLPTEEQKRVLGEVEDAAAGDHRASLLFEAQGGGENEELSLADQVKPVSVREFQHAVNRHVRATPDAIDPFLFPESAAALEAAKEEKLAVISITRDHLVHDDAKDEKVRTYGAPSWYRADGQVETDRFGETEKSKTCDWSRYGMVVAGPGRSEVFKVCINKEKCKVHWPEQAAAAERRKKAVKKDAKASGGGTRNQEKAADKEKQEEAKREAQVLEQRTRAARWMKAGPALVGALVEALEKMSAKRHVQTLLDHFAAEQWDKEAKRLQGLVPASTKAFARIVATMLLEQINEYGFEREILRALQHVGLKAKDVEAIVDAAVPPVKSADAVKAEKKPKGKKKAKVKK